MGLLVNVAIAAIIALIIYFVATALIAGHAAIIGLVCLLIFILLAFAGYRNPVYRSRGPNNLP